MKSFWTILTHLFLGYLGFGQDTVTMHNYGGQYEEKGSYIFQVNDGFVLVGTTSSFGKGPTDVYVLNLDQNFEITASRTYGGHDVDYITYADTGNGSIFISGVSNTERSGDYTGFILEINQDLELINRAVLDYGERTIPNQLLWHGGELLVSGLFLEDQEGVFVSAFSADLIELYKKEFDALSFGQIKSWVSIIDTVTGLDSILAIYSVVTNDDSTSHLAYYDRNWNELNSWIVPDSIGHPRRVQVLRDSSVFVIGDKVDASINGDIPYASFAKLEPQLDEVLWRRRFHFEGSGARVWGRIALELNDSNILIIGNTDVFEFNSGKSVFIAEFEYDGEYVNNAYIDETGDEIMMTGLLLDSDSILLSGSRRKEALSESDLCVMRIPSKRYDYSTQNIDYPDNLDKTLFVPNQVSDAVLDCFDLLHNDTGLFDEKMMEIYSIGGSLIRSFEANDRITVIDNLSAGVYIFVNNEKSFKCLISD